MGVGGGGGGGVVWIKMSRLEKNRKIKGTIIQDLRVFDDLIQRD